MTLGVAAVFPPPRVGTCVVLVAPVCLLGASRGARQPQLDARLLGVRSTPRQAPLGPLSLPGRERSLVPSPLVRFCQEDGLLWRTRQGPRQLRVVAARPSSPAPPGAGRAPVRPQVTVAHPRAAPPGLAPPSPAPLPVALERPPAGRCLLQCPHPAPSRTPPPAPCSSLPLELASDSWSEGSPPVPVDDTSEDVDISARRRNAFRRSLDVNVRECSPPAPAPPSPPAAPASPHKAAAGRLSGS